MADDAKNQNVKTMERDLAVAKAAQKGAGVPEVDPSSDLLEIVRQKLAEARAASNISAKQKIETKTAPITVERIQSIPKPTPKLESGETTVAFDSSEDLLDEARRRDEADRKKLEEEQLRRVQEEKKRAEARLLVEKERQQRESARQIKEEQKRQFLQKEDQRRKEARQLAEQERQQREKNQQIKENQRHQALAETEAKKLEKEKEIERQRAEELANRRKEEQMMNEMERLERQKQTTLPVVLRELKKRIRIRRTELEKKLVEFAAIKTPISEKKFQMEEKITIISRGELRDALEVERQIEAKEEEFLKTSKHRQTSQEQEKILSQKLWEIEDKRKAAEKTRWEIEDRIKKIKAEIQQIELEIANLSHSETRAQDQIKTLAAHEKLVDFAEWKKGVEDEIILIEEEHEAILPTLEQATMEREVVQAALEQLNARENSTSENLKTAGQKEKETQDQELKRSVEQSRWEIENELRRITQEKWESEKQAADAISFEKEQQAKLDKINAKRNSLEDKISAQEMALSRVGISTKKLRDQIASFLIENELEIDPELLGDITQIEEIEILPPKPASLEQKESSISQDNVRSEMFPKAPIIETEAKEKKETSMPVGDRKNLEEIIPTSKPSAAAVSAAQEIFREPIDEQKLPFNVPIFPDQDSDNAPGKNLTENDPQAPIPQEQGKKPSPDLDKETEAEPEIPFQYEAGANLDNRWTEIANANDAVIAQKDKKGAVSAEGQPLRAPKRAKNNRKIIIQILTALLILGIIGGIGSFIILTKIAPPAAKNAKTTTTKKTPAGSQNSSQQQNASNNSQQSENQTSQTVGGAPQSLIATVSTITIITDNLNSVQSLILPYLTTKRDVDGYYRLLIKDKNSNTYIGLRQVFDIFKIKPPSSLLDNLNSNATIFLYTNRGQNRFGFIAQTSNAGNVAQIMKGWENTIEQDAGGLFNFLGKQQPAKTPGNLQSGTAGNQQISYRYTFFQPESANLGICYAVYKNYFIFTSSVDSLSQIFNQLPQ